MTHSEIRSRAGIPSIKSSLLHHQLRWLDHATRLPHNSAPHRVLYGQLKQGHRSAGGQKKRFKSILKKCNYPFHSLRLLHPTALPMPTDSYFDAEYDHAAALRCNDRHQHAAAPRPHRDSAHQCPLCGRLAHWPLQPQ